MMTTRILRLCTLDGAEPTTDPAILADRREQKQLIARIRAHTAPRSAVSRLLDREEAERERHWSTP